MMNRIVEVATDGVHLSLSRGFLKLSRDGTEIGRVSLPDIGAVIVRGHSASLSLNLAARLALENIPLVLCGPDQAPASVVWPVGGHHDQGHIIEAQSQLTRPQRKKLWQALVRAKIRAQADVLAAQGVDHGDLLEIADRVRSGDPDNQEAFAARRYWPRLMKPVDPDFGRDMGRPNDMLRGQEIDGARVNGWVNYGYAVLRAGATRSVLAAGLHPSLSIHHESRGEAMRLTSELMEPFRPYVDLLVRRLTENLGQNASMELDPVRKAAIVSVLSLDLCGPYGASSVQTALDRLCQSLAEVCLGERRALELPQGLADARRNVGAAA